MTKKTGKSNNNILFSTVLNTYGTLIYYFMQWVTTVLVVRMLGYDENGVFSLCISFTNIFGFISRFGERNYQLADVNGEHSVAQYVGVRLVAVLLSVVGTAAALFFVGFNYHTVICCLAYSVFKLLEAVTDFYHTLFQQIDNYVAIAVSYTLKAFLPLAGFAAAIYFWGLFAGIAVMTVIYLLTLLYDQIILKKNSIKLGATFRNISPIIKACIPIMLFTLITPYMTFIGRYLVSVIYNEEQLGYYSTISIVVVVMSTLAGSVWQVIIPKFTRLYVDKQNRALVKAVLVVSAGTVAVGVIAVIAGELLGTWAFTLIFGEKIADYMYLLRSVLIASMMLVASSFFSTMLIIMGKRTTMLICNIIGAVVLTAVSRPLIVVFGLDGANYALIIGFAAQIVLLVTFMITGIKRNSLPDTEH